MENSVVALVTAGLHFKLYEVDDFHIGNDR